MNQLSPQQHPRRLPPATRRHGNGRPPGGSHLDGFGRFLREATRVPLLTHAQEIALARQVERGNRAAVNQLIEANIRLAVSLAEPLVRVTRLPLEDLVQEGTLGLRRAAEKFDWRRGHKFSTYATWWVRQAMRRLIARQGHPLHVSSHIHERLGRVRRTVCRLTRQLGRAPGEPEIAEAMQLPPQKVSALLLLAQSPVPLDAPGEDGDALRALEETIQDRTAPSPENEALQIERRAHLDEVLDRFLAPRERSILCLLFGYPSGTPLTALEVADRFGISAHMVKKIQSTALAKLRSPVVVTLLKDFLDPEP